jgi:hypothetical protein
VGVHTPNCETYNVNQSSRGYQYVEKSVGVIILCAILLQLEKEVFSTTKLQILFQFQIVTSGLTCSLAMKFAGMSDFNDIPEDFPTTLIKQKQWLERIARRIVHRIWLEPAKEDIRIAAEAYRSCRSSKSTLMDDEDVYPYCFCHEGNINDHF